MSSMVLWQSGRVVAEWHKGRAPTVTLFTADSPRADGLSYVEEVKSYPTQEAAMRAAVALVDRLNVERQARTSQAMIDEAHPPDAMRNARPLIDYRVEFPDYDPATLPAIPEGWEDCSWHNDACPSFNTKKGEIVYIDFADQKDRENEGWARFMVMNDPEKHDNNEMVFESDDWQAVLAFVARPYSTEALKARYPNHSFDVGLPLSDAEAREEGI